MSDDRRSVKTYVPAEQKDRWREHADELDMSQSEFVRTMVQAGRRGFSTVESEKAAEPDLTGSDPEGESLEARVETALADGPLSWEALVETVVGDFEDRLADALDALQDRNRVRYNGRKGGYTLTDE